MFFLSPLFTVCTYGCGIPWRHRILNSGLENGCEQKWRRRRGRKKQTNEHSTDTVSTIPMVELHLSLCQNGQFSIYLTHLRLFSLFSRLLYNVWLRPFFFLLHQCFIVLWISWKYISIQKTSFSVSFYLLRQLYAIYGWLCPKLYAQIHVVYTTAIIVEVHFYKVHLYHFFASLFSLSLSLSLHQHHSHSHAQALWICTFFADSTLLILHSLRAYFLSCDFFFVGNCFLLSLLLCPFGYIILLTQKWKWKDVVESTWCYKGDDDDDVDEDILHNKV